MTDALPYDIDPSRPLERLRMLGGAYVMPEAERCVECGTCTYNCPIGIDVRAHAWRGRPIQDRHCLSCGECVRRCPRQVLRFLPLPQAEVP